MAESIVSFALDKLVKFIDEEWNSLSSLPEEIRSMNYELRTIKSVLQDAEKKAEDNNGIKEWLSQVREVSWRIEDSIDEYFMLQHEKEASSNFISKSGRSILQLRPKHKLVSTIKEIAKEIQEIYSRKQRYDFIATDSVIQEQQSLQNQRVSSAFVEESELIGFKEPMKEILSMLNVDKSDGRCNMISVVGMGGLGKTTLVGKVYKDTKKWFGLHAWITVSQSYNTVDVLKNIMKQFLEDAPEKDSLEKIETLKDLQSITNELRNYLERQQKRHIVVLDDVWDGEMTLCIKSALYSDIKGSGIFCTKKKNGSRILITTRDHDVANSWTAAIPGLIYKLNPLPYDVAYKLFCNKVFGTTQCPLELDELSSDIIKKCNGLPLAIVTIGGLLSTKRKTISEWRKLRDNLGSELQSNSQLQSIPRTLLLSYHELPYYLKPCFLYLGMFPEDYSINCMKLARLWIAEGFVEYYTGKTLEEVAQEYLTALIHRNLVQVSHFDPRGRFREIRVHDILHKMILLKLEESGFCQMLPEKNPIVNHHFRRISSHDCTATDKDLESFNFKCRFHSILLSGHERLVDNMFSSFGRKFLRFLRILDLQDCKIQEVPEEVGDLYYLHYMSLRQTDVRKLPKTIGKLWNLQTLDLKQTFVSELPKEMKHVHKLRHLLVYNYDKSDSLDGTIGGFRIAEGVLENMKELQKLAHLDVSTGCQVAELGSLKQLTRLGITELRKEDGVGLCQAIQEMKHLKSLSIQAINQIELIDIQVLESPPLSLECLYLKGHLEKLPNWITKLSSLTIMGLKNSRLKDDPVSLLQGLPNLVYLILEKAYDGEMLDFGINGFSKLDKLTISELSNLKRIKGSLPLLRSAYILVNPEQLIHLPPHIQDRSRTTRTKYLGKSYHFYKYEN